VEVLLCPAAAAATAAAATPGGGRRRPRHDCGQGEYSSQWAADGIPVCHSRAAAA